MSNQKVTLVQWSDSQNCISCPNGTFVMGGEDDTRIGDSAYLCFANKETQDKDCWNNICEEKTLSDYVSLSNQEMLEVIETRLPIGKFWTLEDSKWVGCDNSTGDAWTEDFKTSDELLKWLSKFD